MRFRWVFFSLLIMLTGCGHEPPKYQVGDFVVAKVNGVRGQVVSIWANAVVIPDGAPNTSTYWLYQVRWASGNLAFVMDIEIEREKP